MKAEIIAVGTELLIGQIVNSNAQSMSTSLAEIGVDVMFHTTVGDNEQRIAGSIDIALERCDAVIITGGLGPTHDDLTREAIARATGHRLVRDPRIEAWLEDRFASFGRTMAKSNLRQADVPEGAESLENPRGTAPGIALEVKGRWIFAVPGVPSEMKAMMADHVLPRLSGMTDGEALISRVLRISGLGESDLAQRIAPIIDALDGTDGAKIALLASPGEVRVRITAKAEPDKARALIAPVEEQLRAKLGPLVVGADGETIESVVGVMLRDRGLTLATAESFTGGLLVSRLVDTPGTSEFLRAGYVSYSPGAKMADLGVPEGVIAEHGAVSSKTAIAMAEGVRAKARADIGLSTTGEAGPKAQEEQVGTMYIGLAWNGGTVSRHFVAPGGREEIRRWGAQAGLNLLRLWLLDALEEHRGDIR